ncbi:MAG: sigma-70 family RNA polymerase sigma factor [Terriglobia bacterium]|jgi:RNA polymerase sigma factor for flagellar operon FliA
MPIRELDGKRGRAIANGDAADAQGFTLEAWYRTIENVQSLGVEWLGPTEPGRQFDLCDLREKREILNRALADLPNRQRLVLVLYYVKGLTMKQVAARLHMDESRIPQLRYRALLGLRAAVMNRLLDPRHENAD